MATTTTNYTLYSIPFYFTLAFVPHLYSAYLVMANSPNPYDNVTPRSKRHQTSIEKSIAPACFATYERCRGAHNNLMENMALTVGAVLAGNMMRLNADFMNRWIGLSLLLRCAYTASYMTTERQKWSHVRTGCYLAATSCLFVVYIAAAGSLAEEGMP